MACTLQCRAVDHPTDPTTPYYGSAVSLDISSIFPPGQKVASVCVRKLAIPQLMYNVIGGDLVVEPSSPWRVGTQDMAGVITPNPMVVYPTLTYLDPAYRNASFDFTYTIGGVPATVPISIPSGYYKSTTLYTALRNAVLSATGTLALTFTFDETTFRTKITSTTLTLNSIAFDCRSDRPTVPLADQRIKRLVPSLADMIGCSPEIDTITFTIIAGMAVGYSQAPLNILKDRSFAITCDEVRGVRIAVDPMSSIVDTPWLEGAVVFAPFSGAPGDIMKYEPMADAPWIRVNRPKDGKITLRLSRERYPVFGPTVIDWAVQIDLR